MSSGPARSQGSVARSRRRAANDLVGARPAASASTPALNEYTHAGGTLGGGIRADGSGERRTLEGSASGSDASFVVNATRCRWRYHSTIGESEPVQGTFEVACDG